MNSEVESLLQKILTELTRVTSNQIVFDNKYDRILHELKEIEYRLSKIEGNTRN